MGRKKQSSIEGGEDERRGIGVGVPMSFLRTTRGVSRQRQNVGGIGELKFFYGFGGPFMSFLQVIPGVVWIRLL